MKRADKIIVGVLAAAMVVQLALWPLLPALVASHPALLEAVYVGEVESLCRSAAEFDDLAPWDAFDAWAHRLVGYLATKQALAHELLEYVDRDAPLFKTCREALVSAGQPLLDRAQHAGALRPDTDLWEIIQIVGGIAKIPGEPEQIEHMLQIALDGLRYRA